jgi:hypothetical protein
MITSNKEPLLHIDRNTKKPVYVENVDAAILRIIRLILLEPGTIQTHPEMGVGLISTFRDSGKSLADLESAIKNQISTYMPMYTNISINVELDYITKEIKITMSSDQLRTVIPINADTYSISLENIKN